VATEFDLESDIDDVVTSQDEAASTPSGVDEQAASADPSPATDASKTEGSDALSIVRDVVGKSTEPAAASSAKAEVTGPETGDQQAAKAEDDYSDVPFNKHPRFQKVLADLKTANTKAAEAEADAVRYRNVDTFLRQNNMRGEDAAMGLRIMASSFNSGLTIDEMAEGQSIMAQAKTDPAGAWERMRPWVQQVITAAGEVLPADLKAKVDTGELSSDAAYEMSRMRASLAARDAQQSFAQQRQAADAQAAQVNARVGEVRAWEADRLAKDPHYAAKRGAVTAEVQKLQEAGWVPTTPKDVREQLETAYRAVSGRVSVTPATVTPKPAVTPVRGGHVNGATAPKAAGASSTVDLIRGVIAQHGA